MTSKTEDHSKEFASEIAQTIKDVLDSSRDPSLTITLEDFSKCYLVATTRIENTLEPPELTNTESVIKALSLRIDENFTSIKIIPFEKSYKIKMNSSPVELRISSLSIEKLPTYSSLTSRPEYFLLIFGLLSNGVKFSDVTIEGKTSLDLQILGKITEVINIWKQAYEQSNRAKDFQDLGAFRDYVLLFNEGKWLGAARFAHGYTEVKLEDKAKEEKVLDMELFNVPLKTINKSTVKRLILDSVLPILMENQLDVYESLGYDIVAESSPNKGDFPAEVYKDKFYCGCNSLIQYPDRLEYSHWASRRNEIEYLLTTKNVEYPKRNTEIVQELIKTNFIHPRERFLNVLDTHPLSGMIKRNLASSERSLELDEANKKNDGKLITSYLEKKVLFSNLNFVLFESDSKMDVYTGNLEKDETNTGSSNKKSGNYSLDDIEDVHNRNKSVESDRDVNLEVFRQRLQSVYSSTYDSLQSDSSKRNPRPPPRANAGRRPNMNRQRIRKPPPRPKTPAPRSKPVSRNVPTRKPTGIKKPLPPIPVAAKNKPKPTQHAKPVAAKAIPKTKPVPQKVNKATPKKKAVANTPKSSPKKKTQTKEKNTSKPVSPKQNKPKSKNTEKPKNEEKSQPKHKEEKKAEKNAAHGKKEEEGQHTTKQQNKDTEHEPHKGKEETEPHHVDEKGKHTTIDLSRKKTSADTINKEKHTNISFSPKSNLSLNVGGAGSSFGSSSGGGLFSGIGSTGGGMGFYPQQQQQSYIPSQQLENRESQLQESTSGIETQTGNKPESNSSSSTTVNIVTSGESTSKISEPTETFESQSGLGQASSSSNSNSSLGFFNDMDFDAWANSVPNSTENVKTEITTSNKKKKPNNFKRLYNLNGIDAE